MPAMKSTTATATVPATKKQPLSLSRFCREMTEARILLTRGERDANAKASQALGIEKYIYSYGLQVMVHR